MASSENVEPFPSFPQSHGASSSPTAGASKSRSAHPGTETAALKQIPSNSSIPSQRTRTTSLTQSFLNSNPPFGICQAAGEVASKIPTLTEIRNGSFSVDGWTEEGQMQERGKTPHQIQKRRTSRASSLSTSRRRRSTTSPLSSGMDEQDDDFPGINSQYSNDANRVPPTIPEGASRDIPSTPILNTTSQDKQPPDSAATATMEAPRSSSTSEPASGDSKPPVGPDETGTYPNGYRFPPKHTRWESTVIGLKAFWKFFLTPFGFLITIYALNIVAWGAMLFFVLLNAAPAMCRPTCEDDYSARNIWLEIDSQILNALFCVTGFGLIPWRFRDFYYLIQWRVFKKYEYFRRLAGHNRGWFRLPGSEKLDEHLAPPPVYNKKHPKLLDSEPEWSEEEILELEKNPAIPLPATSMPLPPLTGVRAQPTKPFLIDLVVWMYVLNTVFQACLAGAMWGLNRFTRPSWVTGFLISIGCVVAMVAGIIVFIEGKKIKKVEGIPVQEEEVAEDAEKGKEALGASKSQGQKSHGTGVEDEKEKRVKDVENGGANVDVDVNGDAQRAGLTQTVTRTEKTKGKHWYERH